MFWPSRREKKVSAKLKKKGLEALSGEKMNGEKIVRVGKEECTKKVGKHLNFFSKPNDIKHAYFSKMLMILLM